MKKYIALLLVFTMILATAGCGKKEAPVQEELVSIVLPAEFVGEVTQAELDEAAAESGFKAITLNDDGSAVYTMTKAQHAEMLDGIKQTIDESIDDMLTSGDYSFTDIKANENYSEFTVTTPETELGFADSISVMAFYAFGGMYRMFSGVDIDNVHVSFVNSETGEVISEANSSDREE